MRIVGWDEFSKLPEGTVFQWLGTGSSAEIGDLCIIGEFLGDPRADFTYAQLTPNVVFGDVYQEEDAKRIGIGQDSDYIEIPSGFGRDGLFEYGRRWLVWDEADRKRLADWLLDPAAAVARMNDDPHAIIPIQSGEGV